MTSSWLSSRSDSRRCVSGLVSALTPRRSASIKASTVTSGVGRLSRSACHARSSDTSAAIRPRNRRSASNCNRFHEMACAIEFLVHLMDKDVSSPDDAMVAACALAELFEPNAIAGYTTIESRGHVATFQTAVYPRLPTWPFSKVHGAPITRPYVGTCSQAICEGRTISCSDIATETRFDPSWRAACTEFGLRSVHSAPVFGFDGRPLGTFVTASCRSRHSFDHHMTGFGVYALRTILQKPSHFPLK